MRLAAWNLNNRVGKVRFKPETAAAIAALNADIVVLTEYFPQPQYHDRFCEALALGGLTEQALSPDPGERANRVLVASRWLIERAAVSLPDFDRQFPSNIAPLRLPKLGMDVLGIRVPSYDSPQRAKLQHSWSWIERYAESRRNAPAVIVGDLNTQVASRTPAGSVLRRLLTSGWTRAEPVGGHSYFGHSGTRTEIDHLLATTLCTVRDARYVTAVAGFTLAGAPSGLSDHAVLMAEVEVR